MSAPIAISGMACRFPDADSPAELWRNVLSQRRSFRRIPPERMRAEDYICEDSSAPDHTYTDQASVIEGWDFDRVEFRIAGSTFRSTDPAQWLALDVASRALGCAGWTDRRRMPRERTGVLMGNTLTGDYTRARLLRLRWPYVRRVLRSVFDEEGWSAARSAALVARLEERYKEPFAPIDEDALAGSLSNTIAGRICNAFDLGGGGYTIDGACASSLLAIAHACRALTSGDVDVALAGGVDLSLDPFELVGFAKAGALARGSMRVYDARSEGFWPGEGCGVVVLERLDELLNRGGRPYAVIRGWGISSDGAGAITRPTIAGERRALAQAYERAGVGIGEVDLFEGHGTGTAVGDSTELGALDAARRADHARGAAPVGSIKANIGHTKAAAGVAGLIKAAVSVHERVVPPNTGCEQPHELLCGGDRVLRAATSVEDWPHRARARAGVSGFGFGGINCHLVVEGPTTPRRRRAGREARRLGGSAQDAELIVLSAPDRRSMAAEIDRLLAAAPGLSLSEVGDLAAELHGRLESPNPQLRAALVAGSPDELASGLTVLAEALSDGERRIDTRRAVFMSPAGARRPRIGLLFPGQASPVYGDGGALARRFEFLRSAASRLPAVGEDRVDTAVAQPAIVGCELIGLEFLRRLGVRASVGVGHSVGELSALHWAGVLDAAEVMTIARARGAAMARYGEPGGAMASFAGTVEAVTALLAEEPAVVVAAENGPLQTVISGPAESVDRVLARGANAGLSAVHLRVSHAFHSSMLTAAVAPFAGSVSKIAFGTPRRIVVSTVSGRPVLKGESIADLLIRQLTEPVRFGEAVESAGRLADLLIEVGPGAVLRPLATAATSLPVLSLDAGGPSLRGPLAAAGALFVLGARPRLDVLFRDRFTRPLDLDRPRRFLPSPCELAPEDRAPAPPASEPARPPEAKASDPDDPTRDLRSGDPSDADPLVVVRRLVARRTELPEGAVTADDRLLPDLHLTSIAVAELAAEAAQLLGVAAPAPASDVANTTVAELAAVLRACAAGEGNAPARGAPDGVAAWFRTFAPELVPAPRLSRPQAQYRWRVIVPDDHPLRDEITRAFAGDDGEPAVLVCLPPERHEDHAVMLLEAAQDIRRSGVRRCAFLQSAGGAAGLAKTLYLEHPALDVAVIDMGAHVDLLPAARREAESVHGFAERFLNADGTRCAPVLRERPLLQEPEVLREGAGLAGAPAIGPDDLLLVSGGGKGIGSECALALARVTGAAVALLGRSSAEHDEDLRGNLARFAAAGIRHGYFAADVTHAASVRSALRLVAQELGEVTAIIHASGINRPARLEDLDADELRQTIAPKVTGLRNLLAAVDGERLRLLVTFGSIIGRIGLRGDAHYALANEWLGCELAAVGSGLERCRCLNLEWTVWSGAGMADRLGTVTALAQAGVTPLPVDEGVRILERLVRCPEACASLVVSGRFGEPETVDLGVRRLPLLRFLEDPLVHYPGIELVVEADLRAGSDPYLPDHVLEGSILLPAAVGLEAMAQVAVGLTGSQSIPQLLHARFDRPVTVPPDGERRVRLAALVDADGDVRVVLRSDETGYQVEHFSVTCRFGRRPGGGAPPSPALPAVRDGVAGRPCTAPAELDPARDLYGDLLFQGERFRRVLSYRALGARSCVAEVGTSPTPWFGTFMPQTLILGDPGTHDAVIHAIQPCIPHVRLVPVEVERLDIYEPPAGKVTVSAQERSGDGREFVYEVTVTDASGRVCEYWKGLRLRRVGEITRTRPWPAALLIPYLERHLEERSGGRRVKLALLARENAHRAASDAAIAEVFGAATDVRRRADGRPEVRGAVGVSTAHLDGYTLALAAAEPVGCDVEAVVPRSQARWADLLGSSRLALAHLMATESGSELDIEATRVWAANECLKKSGLPVTQPLTLGSIGGDGWVGLRADRMTIATFVSRVANLESPVVFAVLLGGDAA